MPTDVIVFDAAVRWLAARTRRAVEHAGARVVAEASSDRELAAALRERAGRTTWLVRAGAVPVDAPRVPPASATGRALLAAGATSGDEAWRSFLAANGGDLSRGGAGWPRVDSVLVEDPAVLERGSSIEERIAFASCRRDVRAVRTPSLDVVRRESMIVVEAVTTLHRGGAERVVLDLVRELRAAGHEVPLVVLDAASRSTYETPDDTTLLRDLGRNRAERVVALGDLALRRGADLVHVHLVDGDEITLLARAGVPVVVTLHNARAGWPARLDTIGERDVALWVGCARDVTREAIEAALPGQVRTIWNGIRPRAEERAEGDAFAEQRARARRDLDVPQDALLLLAVANHRPQKRLDRMPGVVAELRARGHDARLVLVGEPVRASAEALAVSKEVEAEAARLGVASSIVFTGSRADVRPLYAAADAVLCTSAFEGLSIVHLEALAAGIPLVTTHVSGTTELAAKHEHVRLVPVDAAATAFADAIEGVAGAGGRTSRDERLAPDFVSRRMGERQAVLFERALATVFAPAKPRAGIVLVTNNLSTGGAQSSARRLLVRLAAAGIPVRAIVIEEQPEFPTPGRAALERAGIAVHVAPRAGSVDPLITARAVAQLVDDARPEAVLFWNAIPEHKVLIADLLLGVRVWDVSPGEMYHASFSRYFARPRVGLPVLDGRDYGRLLAGAIVKLERERGVMEAALGIPVHVVPNGVVVPPTPPLRAERPGGKVIVGTLARVSPDKKLEQLVDAVGHVAPRLDAVEVLVAGAPERGSEDYDRALRERAKGLPIRFVGERESSSFLEEIDLFAMVSEPSGCPNASLEAMASGLALVATDHGGAREQIDDGTTGLVVPRGDACALGEAILSLVRDRQRRVAMGRAAHARARERFDVDRMARDYARICLGIDDLPSTSPPAHPAARPSSRGPAAVDERAGRPALPLPTAT